MSRAGLSYNAAFPPLSSATCRTDCHPTWSKPPAITTQSLPLRSVGTTYKRVITLCQMNFSRVHVKAPINPLPPPNPASRLLTNMLIAHLKDMNLVGGGKKDVIPARLSLGRAAKRPLPTLAPHPPLRNPDALPIPQLQGMNMAVADSSVSEANLGLFSLNAVDSEVPLCTYSGSRLKDLSSVTDESPRYDYIWTNMNASVIIDAYLKHSSFGRYASDGLYDSRCNAVIEMLNGKMCLISTRPIAPNEEIFVKYEPSYWAAKFHNYGRIDLPDLSVFQMG